MSIIDKLDPDEIITLEDGFKYFWIEGKGALSENNLREIADHLEHLNEERAKQIDQYFEEHKIVA